MNATRKSIALAAALAAAVAVRGGEVAADQPAEAEVDIPEITPGPLVTFEEALLMADERNLTLAAARKEIEKASAKLGQSYALILPAIQGGMQYMYRDHEDTVDFGSSMSELFEALGMDSSQMGESEPMVVMPQHDLKGTLGAGMPLVNAQSWYTIGVAEKGVEIAELSVESARQQLLMGVAQAYYMSLMARTLIGLYEAQIRSATHHLDVARVRFEAGTGLKIDVIRAETDLEQARQELLSSHLALDNARDAIGVLTGAGGLPMPVEEPPGIDAPEGDEEELEALAVRERDDLMVKRAMIGLAQAQLDASWMQFVPTLDAAWQLQYQFTEPGDMGSPDRSRWAAVFTLTVPIFNYFRYGDLDEKRAAVAQARLQRDDAERSATMEVRKARRDYLTAQSKVEIAERQAKLANEALALTEASYEAGTGSSLDVTDARRTVSSAHVNLAAQRLQAQIALLELLRSVGEDMLKLAE